MHRTTTQEVTKYIYYEASRNESLNSVYIPLDAGNPEMILLQKDL